LAHIRFSQEIIEVTTFRASHSSQSTPHRIIAACGMLLRDNVYGTIADDVWRRDFTVNALYCDLDDLSLIDYCGGFADVKNTLIKLIGDPKQRYQEDPVRLLRAIRFAGKLEFQLASTTSQVIRELAPLLQNISGARLFDETLKLFHSGASLKTYHLLKQYQLFEQLFPKSAECLADGCPSQILEIACQMTDQRIAMGKTLSPAFLFAVMLWPALQHCATKLNQEAGTWKGVYQQASTQVLATQQKRIVIPRFQSQMIQNIWELQPKLLQHHRPGITHLISHPHFRAAYDFLLLRVQAQEIPEEAATWWTTFLEADESQQETMIQNLPSIKRPYQRKKKQKTAS
jgi:poly(A) polymerase